MPVNYNNPRRSALLRTNTDGMNTDVVRLTDAVALGCCEFSEDMLEPMQVGSISRSRL